MPTYDGLLISQRTDPSALPFFAFAATAPEILSWASIQRTAEQPGAAQRLKNQSHINTIKAFMSASPNNIVPTAITLALRPGTFSLQRTTPVTGAGVELAKLTINIAPSAEKPAQVIDGQHRLLAFEDLAGSPPLLTSAILGADDLERALHFVVINNKSKKVPSDLVKAILAELSPENRTSLEERLAKVRISLGRFPAALMVLNTTPTSPFVNMLDWDVNRTGERRIKPQALESSLKVILAELRVPPDTDLDDAIEILIAMWRGVKASWELPAPVWCAPESKLVQKAGLVAVTEYLVERMNFMIEEGLDVTDPVKIEGFCRSTMEPVPERFWLTQWDETELDTTAGRGMIREALANIRTAAKTGAADPLLAGKPLITPKAE
jgi:DGQHR domain-containing protein